MDQRLALMVMANDLEQLRQQFLSAEAEGQSFSSELTSNLFGESSAGVPLHEMLRRLEEQTEEEGYPASPELAAARVAVSTASPFDAVVMRFQQAVALAESEGLSSFALPELFLDAEG